jgi:hypothetical protein
MTHRPFHFLLPNLLGASALAVLSTGTAACSSSQRSSDPDLESDGEPDGGPDSGDTDLPWDTGTDTDFLVVEPVLVSEEPSGFPPWQPENAMAASFDGEHVAVSWSDMEFAGSQPGTEPNTVFLSFPFENPETAMTSSFEQLPPACDYFLSNGMPNSKPFPHPDGFILLTAGGWSSSDCELTQTVWDLDANLLDGPHSFSSLFADYWVPDMDPHGISDPDGTITTGNLVGIGLGVPTGDYAEGLAILDLDRWGSNGFHDRLAHKTFPWPYVPDDVEWKEFRSGYIGQNLFLHDGVYTVLSADWTFETAEANAKTDPVLARIDSDGNVVQEPTIIEDAVPPVPSGLENTSFSWLFPSFAANEEGILMIANVRYMNLDGFTDYEATIDDPFPVGLWSKMIDFDGASLTAWTQLTEFDSHVNGNWFYGLAWSGAFFGLCYNEPFDTFKFIAMNGFGDPISEPVDLFWEIPPVEGKHLYCDVVAIDDNTFIAILGVKADPPEAYANGLWATRVDVNIPIE